MGILFKSDKDKREAPAVPVEPATSAGLQNDNPAVFLKRNLQNRATEPEALEEGFEISDGLVARLSNNPYRAMEYVFDTEDFLHWKGGKAKSASVANGHLPKEASQKETLRARRYGRLFRSL